MGETTTNQHVQQETTNSAGCSKHPMEFDGDACLAWLSCRGSPLACGPCDCRRSSRPLIYTAGGVWSGMALCYQEYRLNSDQFCQASPHLPTHFPW